MNGGALLVGIAAAAGFILCLVDYFMPHGTIAHSWGTLIVLASTALMLVAAWWIALGRMPRWLLILLDMLIILDVLGTGVCAYFLEAPALLFFMAITFIGWLWHLTSDHTRVSAS